MEPRVPGPRAQLGGPYQEIPAAGGGWLSLKKAHSGSEWGFRTEQPWPLESDALRVLFLGDSYTEGSGRALACNYPEVAAARLADLLGQPVVALNAGVAGHGPDDSLRVLRELRRSGLQFDAVVHQLFLENDFTDNLPGTERRVMGGILFRVPESRFLRSFHPLNGRAAHWTLLVGRLARGADRRGDGVYRETGTCDFEPAVAEAASGTLLQLVRDRFASTEGPEPRLATETVATALAALDAEAADAGVPLVRVVFPERVRVDLALRAEAGLPPVSPDPFADVLAALPTPVLDVTPALTAGAENYRSSDTHLSDLGNLRAGEFVGDALAEALPGSSDRFHTP